MEERRFGAASNISKRKRALAPEGLKPNLTEEFLGAVVTQPYCTTLKIFRLFTTPEAVVTSM